MLSNVILSTYLQYADHTDRSTLPIGVKGRRKTEEEKKKRAIPRAAAAYGRQLKIAGRTLLLIASLPNRDKSRYVF